MIDYELIITSIGAFVPITIAAFGYYTGQKRKVKEGDVEFIMQQKRLSDLEEWAKRVERKLHDDYPCLQHSNEISRHDERLKTLERLTEQLADK